MKSDNNVRNVTVNGGRSKMKSSVDMSWQRRRRAALETTRPELLANSALDSDAGVRAIVARNLMTPIDTLVRLAADPAWEVRYSVTFNPSTPADVLKQVNDDRKAHTLATSKAHDKLHGLK